MGGNRKVRELWFVVLIGLTLSLLVPGGARAGHLTMSPVVTEEVAGPQTVDGFVATVVLWGGGPVTGISRIGRETRQVVRQVKRVLFNVRVAVRLLPARAAEVVHWSRARLDKIVRVAARRITQTQ